jgi:hypothetical protein
MNTTPLLAVAEELQQAAERLGRLGAGLPAEEREALAAEVATLRRARAGLLLWVDAWR